MLSNVVNDGVRQQVSDAAASTQSPPHVGGRDLVGHPLVDRVDVLAVLPQRVRLVDELAWIGAAAGDADQTVAAHDLHDVFVLPQIGNPKGLQDIGAAQQHQLRAV